MAVVDRKLGSQKTPTGFVEREAEKGGGKRESVGRVKMAKKKVYIRGAKQHHLGVQITKRICAFGTGHSTQI